MRKYFFISVFVLIGVIGMFGLQNNKLNTAEVKQAEVCFIYENINVSHYIGAEELERLKIIVDGKKLYRDNPSCGFSENISIKFGREKTFCVARDGCPIIYWKEKNRYIELSEEEKIKIYNILEKYGFFFPCV